MFYVDIAAPHFFDDGDSSMGWMDGWMDGLGSLGVPEFFEKRLYIDWRKIFWVECECT